MRDGPAAYLRHQGLQPDDLLFDPLGFRLSKDSAT